MSGDEIRNYFTSRIQCVGFRVDEHWNESFEELIDEKFVENSDAKTLFCYMQSGDASSEEEERQKDRLVLHVISAQKCAEGVPSDHLPAEVLAGTVTDFSFFMKREAFSSFKAFEKTIYAGHVRSILLECFFCFFGNFFDRSLFGLLLSCVSCLRFRIHFPLFTIKRNRKIISKKTGDLVAGLLRNMNSVFVPMSRLDHSWPENVRKDFMAQIQKYMSNITEMSNQAKGMTVLYIPQDDLSDPEAVAKDKNLIPRLEASLIHWTRQIKEITSSQQESAGSNADNENAGPLDEIEFWRARDLDLSRLHLQLQSKELQQVLQVLEIAKSSYLRHFRLLEKDIQDGSLEARENLRFLNILKDPCEVLSGLTPVEIPPQLPHLLNIVRLIWSISTHYNTADRISNLLRTISNEIIRRCQQSIDLEKILNPGGGAPVVNDKGEKITGNEARLKDVKDSMVLLQQSIDCGRNWKKEYHRICACIKKNAQGDKDRIWNFSEGTIFARLDSFVQRCCDLLEIAEEQIQFAGFSKNRSNLNFEDDTIHGGLGAPTAMGTGAAGAGGGGPGGMGGPMMGMGVGGAAAAQTQNVIQMSPDLPKFSGAKAGEIMRSLFEIETNFLKQVAKLRAVDYDILDVKSTKWHDDFSTFKIIGKDLEVLYSNIINSAFESVSTVASCVQVFDSFYILSKRERIKSFLEKKSVEVGNLFLQEIAAVKREFERFRKNLAHLPVVCGHPMYAGSALWARGLMLRIQRQYEELGTICYLPDNIIRTDSLKDNYNNLYTMLESYVLGVFNDWVNIDIKPLEDLEKRLHTGLLCRVPLPTSQTGGRIWILLSMSRELTAVSFWKSVVELVLLDSVWFLGCARAFSSSSVVFSTCFSNQSLP